MHLCYVDDSGDSRHGTTLTALIVEDAHWTSVLDAWLSGRREIHRAFGVPKLRELHANELYKGRGRYCESSADNRRFGAAQRAATGRIMLSHLSKRSAFTVLTVGSTDRSPATLYARFVARLEDWAEARDTRVLVFYDGQQGTDEAPELDPAQRRNIWERAVRSAAPYRAAHRALELRSRRIREDPMMQDSRYSQLIQAADLLAYGAYHRHRQRHPEIWTAPHATSAAAVRAYLQARAHWPDDTDDGVYWLD